MSRKLLPVALALFLVAASVQTASAQWVDISGWVRQDLRLDFGSGSDEGTNVLIDDPWTRIVVSGDINDKIGLYVRLVDVKPVPPGAERASAGSERVRESAATNPCAAFPSDAVCQWDSNTQTVEYNVPFARDWGLLRHAYVTVHDLTPGLELKAGRQKIYWTLLQERVLDERLAMENAPAFVYHEGPAVNFDYQSDNFLLSGFYAPDSVDVGRRIDILSRERLGARAAYTGSVSDLDFLLGAQAVIDFKSTQFSPPDDSDEDDIGWGVQGQIGRKGLGALYAEYGQPDTDVSDTFWVVGAKLDLLESVGITGFLERDIEGDESAFEFSKKVNDYFDLIFGGDTNAFDEGDDEWDLYLVSRFGVTF